MGQRIRCDACRGAQSVATARCDSDRVLRLPNPGAAEKRRVWTVTELYYLCARPTALTDVVCGTCGKRAKHTEQSRRMSQPNVLLLRVERRVGGNAAGLTRHAVQPETVLTLPGHDRYELSAVVYHQGARAEAGYCYCVAQAHDGKWWRLDDVSARPFRDDVERSQLRSVHLLVYTRPRGQARFAHMGPCSSPAARGGASVGSAWVLRAVRAWAPETWQARASLRGRPEG